MDYKILRMSAKDFEGQRTELTHIEAANGQEFLCSYRSDIGKATIFAFAPGATLKASQPIVTGDNTDHALQAFQALTAADLLPDEATA